MAFVECTTCEGEGLIRTEAGKTPCPICQGLTKIYVNPGSPQAVGAGCTCPVIDNHYGKGVPTREGKVFITSGDCEIHGKH